MTEKKKPGRRATGRINKRVTLTLAPHNQEQLEWLTHHTGRKKSQIVQDALDELHKKTKKEAALKKLDAS